MLRFWETRFTQIKPLKRGGGRRYYRPDDVQLLKGIRHLLYDQGFTIKGVQRILKEQGARHVVAIGETGSIRPIAPQPSVDAAETVEFVEIEDTHVLAAPVSHGEPRSFEAAGLSDIQRETLASALETLEQCRALLEKARS